MNTKTQTANLERKLDDGLLLRQATINDMGKLAAFNALIHGYSSSYGDRIAHWTKELISGNHPTTKAEDFILVEDSKTGEIVSSINLISQTFRYADIEFPGGRVELVGTHPNFRRRGLVRAQFDAVHQLSKHYGHQIQIIEGIPWFYRQFGYEPALESGGGRQGYISDLIKQEGNKEDLYNVRFATERDISFIDEAYETSSHRYLVTGQRSQTQWNYEIQGRQPQNLMCREVCIVESYSREPVGFFIQPNRPWGSMLAVIVFEIKAGFKWSDITTTTLQYLVEKSNKLTESDHICDSIGFALGSEHPVYDILPDQLTRTMPSSNWYIRVSSPLEFLKILVPVLEQRLATSVLAGHTGELKISFYRYGIMLSFENGKLTVVTEWRPQSVLDGNARFPELTFSQLLFGYRSISELKFAFADCIANKATSILLNILFPKSTSYLWSLV
jgi:hypothetical protein